VRWRRQNCECRKISADHRNFVAAIESGTLITVFVDLVGKILVISDSESHAREKFGNAREQAHATYLVLFCLRQQSLDQTAAAAITLAGGIDGNRTNLRQVHAVQVKSAASDDASIMLEDNKVADVLADFRQRARQEGTIAGVGRDESVNLFGIGKNRLTRAHGSPRAATQRFFLPWVGTCILTPHFRATPHPGL